MNVVEIRGRLTGTEFFDMVHVTPVTPGLNGLVSYPVNESGVVQSAGTATDPNYTVLIDSEGNNEILLAPKEVTFHDGAMADGNGTLVDVNGYSKLIIEIVRADVTTNTLSFNSGIEATVLDYQLGAKVNSDASISLAVSSTATTTEIWEFDIAGKKYVQIPLTSLTGEGATVTVKGNLVVV